SDALDTVKDFTLNLSRLFKVEFIYRADQSFDEIFAQTLDRLERMGLVEHEGDVVRIGRSKHALEELGFIADLVRDYVESYLLALLTLEDVARSPNGLDRK